MSGQSRKRRKEGEKICADEVVKKQGLLQPIPGQARQLQSGRIFAPSPSSKKSGALDLLQTSYESSSSSTDEDEEVCGQKDGKRIKISGTPPNSETREDKLLNASSSSFVLEINGNVEDYFSDAEDILDNDASDKERKATSASVPAAYKEDIVTIVESKKASTYDKIACHISDDNDAKISSSSSPTIKPTPISSSFKIFPEIITTSPTIRFSPKEISTPISQDLPQTPPKPAWSATRKAKDSLNTCGTPPQPNKTPAGFHDNSFVSSSDSVGDASFSPNGTKSSSMCSSSARNSSFESGLTLVDKIRPLCESPDGSLVDAMAKRVVEEEEPMEWDDVDPGIKLELKKCRQDLERNGHKTTWEVSLNFKEATSNHVYVVVDTNVWISQLDSLEAMLDDNASTSPLIIYVPWTVLCELDSLKSSNRIEVASSARKAVQIIVKRFQAKSKKLTGQSGKQEKEASKIFTASSADDKILQACLQLSESGKQVQLMTQDKNLIAKSCASNITIYRPSTKMKNNNNVGLSVTDYVKLVTTKPGTSKQAAAKPELKTLNGSLASRYLQQRLSKVESQKAVATQGDSLHSNPDLPSLSLTPRHQELLGLLQDVWCYSRIFAVSACHSLGIQPTDIVWQPGDETMHGNLDELGTMREMLEQLESSLRAALAVPIGTLRVTTKAVLIFQRFATLFFPNLNRLKKCLIKDHNPVQPQLMLDLFKDATQRLRLEQGLLELGTYLKNLAVCQRVCESHRNHMK